MVSCFRSGRRAELEETKTYFDHCNHECVDSRSLSRLLMTCLLIAPNVTSELRRLGTSRCRCYTTNS